MNRVIRNRARLERYLRAVRRAQRRPVVGEDAFPETADPDKRKARYKALRRRRAANKVAKQSRKRNQR